MKILYQPNRENRRGNRSWSTSEGERLELKPGYNVCPDELVALVRKELSSFDALVERSVISIVEQKAPGDLRSTEFTVKQLREGVIDGITDVALLEDWLTDETRSSAKNAISDRIEELAKAVEPARNE